MLILVIVLVSVIGFFLLIYGLHFLSYSVLKNRILRKQKWEANICCGKTDGGGVNVDIVKHSHVPCFVLVGEVYNLPFKDRQFSSIISSHTIEHLDDPQAFYQELKRISEKVTIVIPPLWDILGAFAFLEHKHLFLSFKKEHHRLPPCIKLPFSSFIQKKFGQKIKA
ncbi:MAG: methyltransferase domain-containing protein [Candidatus Aminicenantales bacterium]